MMNQPAVLIATGLITSIPFLVIAVVGIVLARSKLRQEHAKARRLATIGFSLLGLQALIGAAGRAYVTSVVVSGGTVASSFALAMSNVATYLLLAISLVLLLCALLAD